MLTEKLRSLIDDSAKVSDAEAREWFKWNNTYGQNQLCGV